jgi:hypothetical protein
MKKALVTLILIIGLVSGAIGGYFLMNDNSSNNDRVGSFEECAGEGNIIQESYPRVCRTPDGQSFTEDVSVPVGD